MMESPPTWVGTGFTNLLPSRLAGLIGIQIGWHKWLADSPIDLSDERGETEGIQDWE